MKVDKHKVGKNGQQSIEKKKIMNFPVITYRSQNVVQRQLNVAPSHDSETVTFRKSPRDMYKEPLSSAIFHGANFLEIFEVRKATF